MRECKPRDSILKKIESDLAIIEPVFAEHQIFLCFTCDPYPNGVDTSTTREAIKLIHEAGLFVRILTKNPLGAQRDFDLLLSEDSFGVTLTFADEYNSHIWEPGANNPFTRITMLQRAHAYGLHTWVSFEPVIDPIAVIGLIKATADSVDEYRIGCWNHDARAKKIGYRKFGLEAMALLNSLGKRYVLKEDLRKRMEVGK